MNNFIAGVFIGVIIGALFLLFGLSILYNWLNKR